MAGEDENQNANPANPVNIPAQNDVQRVAVKLPPFWPTDAEIWFQQVEAQFQLGGILMDATKFYTLLTAVDTKILAQVNDAVLNPPAANKYDNLKKAMLEQFAISDQKKIKTLLEEIHLGDKKPSGLLNEMRILGGTKVGDELLKQMWLQRLPSQIRMIVSTSGEDLANVAKMADKLMELGDFSQINVASTSSFPSCSNSSSNISVLEAKIDALTKQVNQMQFNRRSRSNFRDSSTKRDPTPSAKKQYETCWWHFKFGENAKRCKPPCNFNQSKK